MAKHSKRVVAVRAKIDRNKLYPMSEALNLVKGNANAKPELSQNFEIGTKWNLLDDKLLFTAAAFRTTKKDVMEAAPSGTGYDSAGMFNTGKNRVQGIEFGLAGNVTRELQLQAGVAFMKSKVLDSVNAANVGNPLSNFADRAVTIQGKYQFTRDFGLGAVDAILNRAFIKRQLGQLVAQAV